MKVAGIILGSGIGQRFGADFPKQFMNLNGKMVIQYTIDALRESKVVDYIICTLPKDYFKPESIEGVDKFIPGGENRSETIANALKMCPADTKYVIFHDAVRPFIKPSHIRKCLISLEVKPEIRYVVTAQPITDALISVLPSLCGTKVVDAENREQYRLCQSPEVFDYKTINDIYQNNEFIKATNNQHQYIAKSCTFDPDIKGEFIDYLDNNQKITYEEDLFKAEQLMKYATFELAADPELNGKKILLFGGTGDIGGAVKDYLAALGAIVTAPTRQEFDLVGPNREFLKDQVFDCVIHCAAAHATDAEGLVESYDRIMQTNFKSVIDIVDISQKTWLRNGGSIIIFGSTSANYGRKNLSLYSASKGAINTFVEAYHQKMLEKNIRINVIAPARVKGRLWQKMDPKADQSKMISPKRLAEITSHYVNTKNTGKIIYIKVGLENKKL